MRWLKISGGVIVAAVLLFVFVANYSIVESRFRCPGEFIESTPSTAFMKIERYRWWVGLWSNSDAAVTVEIPNRLVYAYYSESSEEGGDTLLMYDSTKKFRGRFSTLSNVLWLDLDPYLVFEGSCKEILQPQ
jgi:hypothetical protein